MPPSRWSSDGWTFRPDRPMPHYFVSEDRWIEGWFTWALDRSDDALLAAARRGEPQPLDPFTVSAGSRPAE